MNESKEAESKILKNTVREEWVACATSVQHMNTEGLVQQSLCGLAKLTVVGKVFKFSACSLQDDILNHIILTMHYAECLENVSMEMWGWLGRRGWGWGWVCGPRYNKNMGNAH